MLKSTSTMKKNIIYFSLLFSTLFITLGASGESLGDMKVGDFANACQVTAQLDTIGMNAGPGSEANFYRAGYCRGMVGGMVSERFGKCGVVPGVNFVGFARHARILHLEFEHTVSGWAHNSDTSLVTNMLNKIKVNERGCPLNNKALWSE